MGHQKTALLQRVNVVAVLTLQREPLECEAVIEDFVVDDRCLKKRPLRVCSAPECVSFDFRKQRFCLRSGFAAIRTW